MEDRGPSSANRMLVSRQAIVGGLLFSAGLLLHSSSLLRSSPPDLFDNTFLVAVACIAAFTLPVWVAVFLIWEKHTLRYGDLRKQPVSKIMAGVIELNFVLTCLGVVALVMDTGNSVVGALLFGFFACSLIIVLDMFFFEEPPREP